MSDKIADYCVEDVLSDGKYKVRHKTTDHVYLWDAHDCELYTEEQIQNIFNEVKTVATITDENILRYYDTILHAPAKVLYFVMEFTEGRSLEEFINECSRTQKQFNEAYLWYILYEVAKVCKLTYGVKVSMLKKQISSTSVFITSTKIKVNCFSLENSKIDRDSWRPIHEIGCLIYRLCYLVKYQENIDAINDFLFSDDLKKMLKFMLSDHVDGLKPDALIFHPTLQVNLKKNLDGNIFLERKNKLAVSISPIKCGSYIELNQACHSPVSPNYVNVSWMDLKIDDDNKEGNVFEMRNILSPTLSALALELPGFKPKLSTVKDYRDPQQITEGVLSQQWLTRLQAIRHREEALNRRERDLIDREIASSPGFEVACISEEPQNISADNSPRINDLNLMPTLTLQPIMSHKALPSEIESNRMSLLDRSKNLNVSTALVPKKPQRRSASLRARNRRKKIYSYEDLDSSLSAGDISIVATTTKLSADLMPRPSLLENQPRKRVHFTRRTNPFAEYLDVSGTTYTFYELENVDRDGYQVPRKQEFTKRNLADEISKFKYLDLERLTSEKRSAMESWTKSSPKKLSTNSLENFAKPVLADITNANGKEKLLPDKPTLLKAPSRMSVSSKISNSSTATKSSKSSKCSDSSRSQSIKSVCSFLSYNTRSSKLKDKLDNITYQENKEIKGVNYSDVPRKSRKSLLPFKTPFKF